MTTATDGREGLRIFHSGRPDIVILDVGLPEMDGWTVLARIRELSEVPVLMLSALTVGVLRACSSVRPWQAARNAVCWYLRYSSNA